MSIRFFLLTCGTADEDQSTLTPGRGAGARVRVPIPAYLLQTDGRTILFDTGMPDFCYTGDPRALLLRLPNSGVLLVTFDAVYTRALWEADELGAAADPAGARASMDRLRAVAAQTGAQVVCGHDLEQWAALRHPPAYYD